MTLTAAITSFNEDAPVANKIGFFFFATCFNSSCQVISPDPILCAATKGSI